MSITKSMFGLTYRDIMIELRGLEVGGKGMLSCAVSRPAFSLVIGSHKQCQAITI